MPRRWEMWCIPDRFFEHGPGEWGVAVLVHESWVDGSVPRTVGGVAAAAVAGHQVEEFGAGEHLAGRSGCDRCPRWRPTRVAVRRSRVAAAQVERLVAGFGAAHADHAAQVGVVAAFGAAGVRGLVERRAGWVQQERSARRPAVVARFAGAGEQGHRHGLVHGWAGIRASRRMSPS